MRGLLVLLLTERVLVVPLSSTGGGEPSRSRHVLGLLQGDKILLCLHQHRALAVGQERVLDYVFEFELVALSVQALSLGGRRLVCILDELERFGRLPWGRLRLETGRLLVELLKRVGEEL